MTLKVFTSNVECRKKPAKNWIEIWKDHKYTIFWLLDSFFRIAWLYCMYQIRKILKKQVSIKTFFKRLIFFTKTLKLKRLLVPETCRCPDSFFWRIQLFNINQEIYTLENIIMTKIDVSLNVKPYSQKRRIVNRNFKTVRIGWFYQFKRYQTWKICGIVWVIFKKL